MKACETDPCTCPADQVCATSLAGDPFDPGQTACLPGLASAEDGDACVDIGDCNANSLCLVENPEHPGGECNRSGCTVGTDSTCTAGGDGHCVTKASLENGVGLGTRCVDACTTSNDCRQGDGYRCFDGGGTVGKYCRHPHIGDACTVDSDCGNAAEWDCMTGASFPGGYCTLAAACPSASSDTGCVPASSICRDPPTGANYCVDRCIGPVGTQSGCRTGYTCEYVDGSSSAGLACLAP
jgi:hypothetical protein